MGTQLVWLVPLCLQQQSVIFHIAETESVTIGLYGKHLREVAQRFCRCLEEECLVAVQRCIMQTYEQVCLVARQHEVVIGCQRGQFFGRGYEFVPTLRSQHVVIAVPRSLYIDVIGIFHALISGCYLGIFLYAVDGIGSTLETACPHDVFWI